jgi:hypothetical protein
MQRVVNLNEEAKYVLGTDAAKALLEFGERGNSPLTRHQLKRKSGEVVVAKEGNTAKRRSGRKAGKKGNYGLRCVHLGTKL